MTEVRRADRRDIPALIELLAAQLSEHGLETLVGQHIFGLTLGYVDRNNHDEQRKDPTFAVLRAS